jgi:hypothetical protein
MPSLLFNFVVGLSIWSNVHRIQKHAITKGKVGGKRKERHAIK